MGIVVVAVVVNAVGFFVVVVIVVSVFVSFDDGVFLDEGVVVIDDDYTDLKKGPFTNLN